MGGQPGGRRLVDDGDALAREDVFEHLGEPGRQRGHHGEPDDQRDRGRLVDRQAAAQRRYPGFEVFQVRKAVSLLPVLTARERVTFERHQTILCIAAHGTLR